MSFEGCWIKTLQIMNDALVECRGQGEGIRGMLNAPMTSDSGIVRSFWYQYGDKEDILVLGFPYWNLE